MTMGSSTMRAVRLLGHGGLERLEFTSTAPVPVPQHGEVLIRVASSSVNNTDINTRLGWYSRSVAGPTQEGAALRNANDGGWSGAAISFPRIQGADAAGEIVELGEGVPRTRLGERVIVRTMLRAPVGFAPFQCWTFGSECDGGFAEFCTAPAADVFAVNTSLTDIELGCVPCAYGTAEGMLQRVQMHGGERALVLGASGGVGAAAVQLLSARGAHITAVASASKSTAMLALGAARVLPRSEPLLDHTGEDAFDLVVDLVGGAGFTDIPKLLARGGRYVCAGAIAGPDVRFDLRDFYLKDLSFYGCAAQEDSVFNAVVKWVESNSIKPQIASVFPLERLADAQRAFVEKRFVGKIAIDVSAQK